MDAAAIAEEYAQLSKEKDELETEIGAIVEELTSGPNPPGLKGALVDAEGFPRADIDVYRVRHQRHTLACKQTDHKIVMKRIEELLPQLFQARKSPCAPTKPLERSPPPTAMEITSSPAQQAEAPDVPPTQAADKQLQEPFAVVDSVQPDSPASLAGLCAGDQVLAFGTANAGNHRNLQAIREIVSRNLGSAIHVVVQRPLQASQNSTSKQAYAIEELALTPQRWHGAGVLGCLLLPVP